MSHGAAGNMATREDLENLQQQQRQLQGQINQLCTRLEQSGMFPPQNQNLERQRVPQMHVYHQRNMRN